MERKEAGESKTDTVLIISANTLIENLSNPDMYEKNPTLLRNLQITDINGDKQFKEILQLLKEKNLSGSIISLNIRNNDLRTLEGIEQLTTLTSLDVHNNRLITLAGIKQLTALKSLGVNYNQLTTLAEIGQLTSLVSLSVGGNQLTTLSGIEALTALTSLSVGANKLTTLAGIKQLTALKSLDVSYNELTRLVDMGRLTALKSLDVSYNELTRLVDMGRLANFESLNVSCNHLRTLAGIEQLTALTSLNVSTNQLTTLADIAQLTALTSLNVWANKLTTLAGIEQLAALASLNVDQNQLTTLAGIGRLPALTSLGVNYNQLTTLAGIGRLPALTSLGVNYNQLTTLAEIGQLTSLVSLSVGGNQLTTLSGIEALTALTSLSVGANKLTTLAGIKQLTALRWLSVEVNKLTTLADIKQLTALESLDFRFNELTTLPVSLGNLPELQSANFFDNPLPANTPKTLQEIQAQWRTLQDIYRRLFEMNKPFEVPNSVGLRGTEEIAEILTDYDADEDSAQLSTLSPEELAILKESVEEPEIREKKVQAKIDLAMVESLEEAITKNKIKQFQDLFSKHNKSINLDIKRGEAAYTLLHKVALNKLISPEFTRILLEHGADPNLADRNALTPVMIAVAQGRHDILEVYQQYYAPQVGRKVVTRDTWENAAMYYQAFFKDKNPEGAINYKEVRAILDTELTRLGIELSQSSAKANIEVQLHLLSLINENNDVEFKNVLEKNPELDLNVTVSGTRLLHAATEKNNKNIVALLLNANADPNATIVNSRGQAITPVHIAVDRDFTDMLEIYRNNKKVEEASWIDAERAARNKESNADLDAFNVLNALFDAINNKQFYTFEDILSKNPTIDLNASHTKHDSLLHAASRRGVSSEFTKKLLEQGADPNIQKAVLLEDLGIRILQSPLALAVREGRADLIKLYQASTIPVQDNTWNDVQRFMFPSEAIKNTGPDADYSAVNTLIQKECERILAKLQSEIPLSLSAAVFFHIAQAKATNPTDSETKKGPKP